LPNTEANIIMPAGDVKARTIVVTGGGSGIGRAVALLCAKRGDNVAVLDKRGDSARATAREAKEAGAIALGIECDVSLESNVSEAFGAIAQQFGTPYGLFANAGIDTGGLIHELPMDTWRAVMETNLTGVFLSCKYALRAMLAAEMHGSVVCTSSPTGFVALAAGGAGAYSATKAGISALVRCMAVDYARHGIRVNAIVPGATETPLMWNNVPPDDVPRMRVQVSNEIPLGRLAQPEDPARAVAWLLSEESSYVTGSHLVCDGGILAKASISV
jgi:NAD(P)-dependent dehydrogenase (short-subunit alcohol dehydrogenase family)